MTQKIPYPAKDPRYLKVWYQIQKRGKTLEEALEIVNNKSTPVESELGKQIMEILNAPR